MSVPDRLATALGRSYRLERELGQGGMATVYLAEDLKHDRKVAIKLLHPELSAVIGGERFLTEIKTTAGLQHPHILGLIDSGEADGLLYYVMPFVEGETLRARLTRETQLPVRDALRLAGEIAAALDFAHKRGIVHRDIKPENILLQDGRALVADFGIALAVQQAGGARLTQTGMSLGTPSYMSPEQAMGEKAIDARSDVYALGALTYEMLQGEPPFTGSSSQAIVAQVLTSHPRSLRELRPNVPAHIDAAVLTALEKLPADRQVSTAEFARQLEGEAAVPASRTHERTLALPAASRSTPGAHRLLPFGLALLAAGALAGWGIARRGRPATPPDHVMRFSVLPPPGHEIAMAAPSLSADGQLLAFVADSAGTRRLFLRSMGAVGARRVAGSEGIVSDPVLAPDGASVTFQLGDRLMRVATDGSQPPATVPGAPAFARIRGQGFDLADDGAILLTPDFATGLLRLDPAAQRLDTLRRVDVAAGEYGVFNPSALPGGRAVLFSLLTRSGYALMALDPDDGREVMLVDGATSARFGAPSSLVYSQNGDLYAVEFDPATLRLVGDARPIAQGLPGSALAGSNAALFDVSQAGVAAFLAGNRGLFYSSVLALVDRQRGTRTLLGDSVGSRARFSPDGRSILAEDSTIIWLHDLARAGRRTRISRGHLNYVGVWTPDGRRIVTSTYEGGPAQLWSYALADPADTVRLTTSPRRRYAASFTPDGSTLAFIEITADAGSDILARRADGSEVPLVRTPASEHHPRFAPDGRRLAFVSEETGQAEVYLQGYPEAGRAVRVSVDGGNAPVWDPSGRELYYVHDEAIMSVSVSGEGAPTVGPPRLVLRVPDLVPVDDASAPFDMAPDGRQFLLMLRPGARPTRELHVLVNLRAGPQ